MTTDNLMMLLPLIIIQFTLMIIGVVSVIKKTNFNYLNKVSWLLLVMFIQIIGPIAYFIMERDD